MTQITSKQATSLRAVLANKTKNFTHDSQVKFASELQKAIMENNLPLIRFIYDEANSILAEGCFHIFRNPVNWLISWISPKTGYRIYLSIKRKLKNQDNHIILAIFEGRW